MAYEMLVGLHLTDPKGYQEYRKGMTPILESRGGGFRYDFEVSAALKSEAGHPINRLFAIYFPDRAAKERFYADPAYLKIREKYFEKSVAARTVIAQYER